MYSPKVSAVSYNSTNEDEVPSYAEIAFLKYANNKRASL